MLLAFPPASSLAEDAESLRSRAESLFARGLYGQAAELTEGELRLRRERFGQDGLDVAGNVLRLADLLTKTGRYARAESLYNQSIALYRGLLNPEHPTVAKGIQHLGRLQCERGNYALAKRHLQRALDLYQKRFGEEDAAIASCLHDLSEVSFQRGRLGEAEHYLLRSQVMVRKLLGSEHPGRARLEASFAHLREHQGNFSEARRLFHRARAMAEDEHGPNHPEVAEMWDALGNILVVIGEYDSAEVYLKRALSIRHETVGDRNPDDGTTLLRMATIARVRGDGALEDSLIHEGLDRNLSFYGENHTRVARAYMWLGGYDRFHGRIADAIGHYDKALAIDRSVSGSHFYIPKVLSHLADCYFALDCMAAAESLLEEGARAFEEARLHTGCTYRQAARGVPYARQAVVRYLKGADSLAWIPAERSRGCPISDLLISSETRVLSPEDQAREDVLDRELDRCWGRISALEWAVQADSSDSCRKPLDRAETQLSEARLARESFRRAMIEKYPVVLGEIFPLERIQNALLDDAAIIGWVDADFRLRWVHSDHIILGYVIRSSGPVRWVLIGSTWGTPADRGRLESIRGLRDELGKISEWPVSVYGTEGVTSCAHRVWRDWFAPMTPHLEGIHTLIALPPPILQGIPIEALVDSEGICLNDRYAIAYAPSATVYAWLRERERKPGIAGNARALLVGDALLGPGSPPAPWTRAEIDSIACVLPNHLVLEGAEASEARLAALESGGELGSFDILHIASHAVVDRSQPERSAILLSPGESLDPVPGGVVYDGFLRAEEVVRRFHLDADLVTMSTCQTVFGADPADGYLDLANAFLIAGARSMVVSFARVIDTATGCLMARFYENLTGAGEDDRGRACPMNKADALQEAKMWLRDYTDEKGRRPYQHPAYWADFVLMGDID